MSSLRLVVISDTHGKHDSLVIPEGDVLIHAGDLTSHGKPSQVKDFDRFLGTLAHPHKIIIAGNHDFCFEQQPSEARCLIKNGTYLQDEGIEIEGFYFYGSPWQPWFFDWAFNLHRGVPLREKWKLIPQKTDVLITHGPPLGYGDVNQRGEMVGCEELLKAVRKVRPCYHLYGHIHEGYGRRDSDDTTYVNASTCNLDYEPRNPPIVLDLE